MTYIYLGDKLTDTELRGKECEAICRPDGKRITAGKKFAMLVSFGGKKVIINRRLLRKIKPAS
jgi:hypothetical protein